jgi:metal-dependent amidase/aminoacylase/carboxypeptidase family protein
LTQGDYFHEREEADSDPCKSSTLLPELEAVYKDIHAHPELSMHETRTAQIAADHLKTNGFEVTTGVGKTGVVGILRNGDGPTVMLRADMDGLPI